ncbi:MAG TPA: zinc ribbon domain-containing protein [Chthonomonadaceae bacterium]|nr:zinc ribbon domain-containing protein [Chthonomonadaceae bacterium]
METRYYQAQGIDILRLANELERLFMMQGSQVQHFGDKDQVTVQFKKGSDFAAIFGMQSALTLTMQHTPGGVMAVVGQQKWADKAAAGVVGMLVLWPLAFTAGAGAIQQAQLGGQVLQTLDMLVRQQISDAQIGPIPPGMMPGASPYPQQGTPNPYSPSMPPQQPVVPPMPPAANSVTCANCHTSNDQGSKFCKNCGQPLASPETQKVFCTNCGAEIQPNAAFCSQCGTAVSAKSA